MEKLREERSQKCLRSNRSEQGLCHSWLALSVHPHLRQAQPRYHRSQQYSITALTDSSGNVTERYAYTAYGAPTITDAAGSTLTTSADNNRYTYTGREWDEVLGLYHFRARMYDSVKGRFLARDPLGYVDGLNTYQNYFLLDGTDPFGRQKLVTKKSPKCAKAFTKCRELRNIWNNAGKTFSVKLFDLFLAKKGCGAAPLKAESLVPGITATISSDKIFSAAIQDALSKQKCPSTGKFAATVLPEFLPPGEVINLPGGSNPLVDLPDHHYAIGTIAIKLSGTISSGPVFTQSQTQQGGGVTKCGCCKHTLKYAFTGTDHFSFHDDWKRTFPNPGINLFSAYYRACNYLQNNCGYCKVGWSISGKGNESAVACSPTGITLPGSGPKF